MLPRVKAPLLVIQAEHDDATSPRNAQYILDHAGSVKKEVLLLENSYHVVTVDLERARVAAAMHGFCNAILGASMAASRTPTG